MMESFLQLMSGIFHHTSYIESCTRVRLQELGVGNIVVVDVMGSSRNCVVLGGQKYMNVSFNSVVNST